MRNCLHSCLKMRQKVHHLNKLYRVFVVQSVAMNEFFAGLFSLVMQDYRNIFVM